MNIRSVSLSELGKVLSYFNLLFRSELPKDALDPISIRDQDRLCLHVVPLSFLRRLYPDSEGLERITPSEVYSRTEAHRPLAKPCIVVVEGRDGYAIIPSEDLGHLLGLSEAEIHAVA